MLKERTMTEVQETTNLKSEAHERFPLAIAQCKAERESFLSHRREACLALGRYLRALAKAYGLCNKLSHEILGPLPEHLNACRALELGDDPQKSLSDLKPDWGAGSRLSFPVGPMNEKFTTEE
jgi:hypothetical protein